MVGVFFAGGIMVRTVFLQLCDIIVMNLGYG